VEFRHLDRYLKDGVGPGAVLVHVGGAAGPVLVSYSHGSEHVVGALAGLRVQMGHAHPFPIDFSELQGLGVFYFQQVPATRSISTLCEIDKLFNILQSVFRYKSGQLCGNFSICGSARGGFKNLFKTSTSLGTRLGSFIVKKYYFLIKSCSPEFLTFN
jgi:hypothetical protein